MTNTKHTLLYLIFVCGLIPLQAVVENRDELIVLSNFSPDTKFGHNPFEFVVPGQDLVQGFDAQTAAQLKFRLGFKKVTFKQTPGNELLSALAASEGNVIVISALSITKARLADPRFGFIKLANDSLGLLIQDALVAAHPDLRKPTVALAVLNEIGAGGGPAAQLAKSSDEAAVTAAPIAVVQTTDGARTNGIILNTTPNLQPDSQINMTVALTQLKAGAADSLFTDGPTLGALRRARLTTGFAAVNRIAFNQAEAPGQVSAGFGIALKADNCQLYADIAQAVKDMQADGTLDAMRARWHLVTAFDPIDLTPAQCANTKPSTLLSNPLGAFLFTSNCPQTVPFVP